jgi:acetyl-CoA C-acetyltransferase
MTAFITGWSHTQFGHLSTQSLSGLAGRSACEALAHAGLKADDIDEIYIACVTGNACPSIGAGLAEYGIGVQFKPSIRVDATDASGTAAIFQAVKSIRSGDTRHVLVVGVDKMADLKPQDNVAGEPAFQGRRNRFFADLTKAYGKQYGDPSDALATIAAKNHKNAVGNPFAHFRTDPGFDFCRYESARNPLVCGYLKQTDCAPLSDGAAALVLSSEDAAMWMPRAIRFRARTQVNDWQYLGIRDTLQMQGCAQAWNQAMTMAGIGLQDLSLVETHDSFTIAEVLQVEAMGLAMPGRGGALALEGYTALDGRLPVNPSGGLLARGNPVGATGVSQHVMAALQLCEEAADFQVPDASLAGVYTMGREGFANYVSILERAW